ncbi:MAG TPA: MATE family efflux transporter [Gemmatimonadaceae bacterium]|nr:MATE family efflux transporter [Gemmatimonadaceae bacterium]
MQDLTSGSVNRHLLKTASYMLVTMVFQTLYFLIDLYWVGRLGTDAVAAVGIAGNLTFINLALTQMLGVGTTTVVSHAVGRKNHDEACLLFNQAQVLATVVGLLFLILGLVVKNKYATAMSADAETARLAKQYLLWFLPCMALQFAMVAMGAALRAVGNFKPTMIVASATTVINMVLAPILIFGWLTGHAFGVAGAAISSLIAVIIGVIWMSTYFLPRDSYLRFMTEDWKPKLASWKRMLAIGLPSGFEFALMAVYLVVVYSIARPFGSAAQAGFGIGGRIVQAGFMPVVALGFSVAPVAGQNFGAKHADRVKETFRRAAIMATAIMLLFTIVCHIAPDALVRIFSKDPAVIDIGEEYLRIISYNYIASGLVFVNASMFQAMGNTVPSLITSTVRILIVAVPAVILSHTPGFTLTWVWYLAVVAVLIQLSLSMLLLKREFSRRLIFPAPAAPFPTIPEPAVPA